MRIFTLTLSMPTSTPPNEPNGFQRLRKLLKCLLRSYGLRCVDIRELPNQTDKGVAIVPSATETTQATDGATSFPDAGDAIPGALPAMTTNT